jgi:3-demethoxyubiquinol 3-hydroxylase
MHRAAAVFASAARRVAAPAPARAARRFAHSASGGDVHWSERGLVPVASIRDAQ